MNLFLAYELKVAVLIAVFYIFWRLLAANETWHRLNRVVLLATAIASFVLPLCVITIHQTVEVEAPSLLPQGIAPATSPNLPEGEELCYPPSEGLGEVVPEQSFDWQLLLTIIYIIGVMVVLAKMLLSLWQLHRMAAESEIHPLAEGRQIAVCDQATTPFSWWKTVFLNHQDYEEGTTALLTHELGHIRLNHSADVLLIELLTALQWFNPAMWMLRADLRTIHEYEADQQVLSHGFDDIQYLQLLIRKATVQGGYSLANGISNSALKKRVTMMMKPQTNRRQWLRYAYLLPIIALSLYSSCETKVDYKTKEESAILLTEDDGSAKVSVKVPAGAFFTWLVNGQLAERGVVKENGWWNVRSYHSLNEDLVTLDGKEINKSHAPYVPLSFIKEVKLIQGESPRRIELYTHPVTTFNRDVSLDYPSDYQEKAKAWVFFRVEDAATGQQLKGAELTVVETGQKAKTNEEGWCELKIPLGTTVKATYPGFDSESHEFKHVNGDKIQGWTFWMSKPGEHIYLRVDKDAAFNGDMDAWLAKNIQQPKGPEGKGLSGRVGIWLVVNEDGSVSGVRLKQGVNKVLNDEALRVVRSMPRWKPALKDGKPVKSLVITGVTFDNG